jgi:hypothetical protein
MDQWVQTVHISYKLSGSEWKIFKANSDRDHKTINFAQPIYARSIRIHPKQRTIIFHCGSKTFIMILDENYPNL